MNEQKIGETSIRIRPERCNNCHVCISVCPVKDCIDGSGDIVSMRGELCIGCGRCIKACTRAARYFVDDSNDFFGDLAWGKKLVAIAAPSVGVHIQNRFRFNGWLHSLGVQAVFDGAFGGELSMLACRDYLSSSHQLPIIASTCPAVVTYCKIYKPELLPFLAKIHSPLIFTALMIRHFFPQYDNCEIAAITPCIAKRREFDIEGYITYNVTIANVSKYIRKNRVDILGFERIPYKGPAALPGIRFSLQNGLSDVYHSINGAPIKKARAYNGEPAYIYLNEMNSANNESSFIDCHNCLLGCYRGTAIGQNHETIETQENRVLKIIHKSSTLLAHIKHKFDLIKYYKKDVYPARTYLSSAYLRENIKIPSVTELSEIYQRMKKANTSDTMNCQSCGYDTCRTMAIAIYNGLNKVENCQHYLMATLEEKNQEIKKQKEMATELASKAMAASDAKASFLANMSHEIRTPMNAIIGMSTLFSTENLDETQQKYLKDIKKMSHSLLGIINDILDFSKIEAGKTTLVPVHFNLRTLVDNLKDLSKFLIFNKEITFKFHVEPDVPVWMFADETHLRQVFTNIISNAIKYTSKGFCVFSVEKSEDPSGNIFIIIKVSDSGIGIKKEDMDKLFSSFQRINEKKTRNIKGTGLGLVICKQLVELMGGEISVKSEYQKGSTFEVKLPFIPGSEHLAESDDTNQKFARVKSGETVNILVVDDIHFNIVVALGFLERHNIKADTAHSGEEALVKTREKRYDIIFMDHMMPDMDGIETTAALRAEGIDSPVIALTANVVASVQQQFIEAGMNGFLAKPMDANDLNAVLIKWLPFNKIELQDKSGEAKGLSRGGGGGIMKQTNVSMEQALEAMETPSGSAIDFTAAMKYCGGSEEAYEMILKEFIAGMPPLLDEIEECFTACSWQTYTVKTHAAKSTFATIGCAALSARARELEAAGKSGDTALCAEKTPGFLTDARDFTAALASVLN